MVSSNKNEVNEVEVFEVEVIEVEEKIIIHPTVFPIISNNILIDEINEILINEKLSENEIVSDILELEGEEEIILEEGEICI
jgi:hypothetical protein